MGMLYRRKKLNSKTGILEPKGPWWMKFYDQGKPIFLSTKQYEKREAQKALQKAEGKVADGQRESPKVHQTRFEDLEKDLQLDYELKGRKTWIRRLQHLAHLRKMFGQMRVKSITTDRLQQYISKRMGEGASNATVNRELDCLRRMLKLGASATPPKVGRVPSFPKLKEDNIREGFFEHDEFLALRGACPDHLKIAVSISYYTGMRKGEIRALRWQDIRSIGNGRVVVLVPQSKADEPRMVTCTSTMIEVLERQGDRKIEGDDKVFPISAMTLRRKWERARQLADLSDVTLHDLRRTHGTHAAAAGVDLRTLADRIGHTDLTMLQKHYAAVVGDRAVEAAEIFQKAFDRMIGADNAGAASE